MRYLDIKHYELIAAIDEYGTLKEAASAIGLTQPAATYRVQEIEKRLTISVYEKRGRKLVLTESGRSLLKASKLLLPFIEKVEKEATMLSRNDSFIKLGVGDYDVFFDALKLMNREEFNCFDIKRLNEKELVSSLLSSDLDVILTREEVKSRDFESFKVFSDDIVMICNKDHELAEKEEFSISDICRYPYLTYSRAYEKGMEFDVVFKSNNCSPNSIRVIQSVDYILKVLSMDSNYVTFLSSWVLRNCVYNDLVALNRDDMKIPSEWFLCYNKKIKNRKELISLIDVIVDFMDL